MNQSVALKYVLCSRLSQVSWCLGALKNSLTYTSVEHTNHTEKRILYFHNNSILRALATALARIIVLRQLRRVRHSLDADSAKILVHALVTSRIDYCNGLLNNASSIWTDKLQRVLNAAARVITNTRKFERGLTSILHNDLHWLDLPRRVLFNICVMGMVYKSLQGMAPKYLAELCRPISDVQGRRHLRSAARGLLHTPRYYLSMYQRTEDEPFLMPVHLPGILFQNICGHVICHLTALDTRYRHICSHR